MRPLDGLLVVALEHAISAPFATRHLADLGARVIKIERPSVGDFARGYDKRARGLASHFAWVNRSKESLALDVKHAHAQDVLARLVARADVLVQNLAPGAAARLGLSFEALAPTHPGLIVCDISGYGDSGPQRDRKAYDLLIQSEAGLVSVTGTPDEPVKVGISAADICAGFYAYSNILAALLERTHTERGRRVEISMLEAMAEWMGYPLYYGMDDAAPPPRTGAAHAAIYPYGPFRTGDGGIVMLGVQNEREWGALCTQVLKHPELATDARFATNTQRVAHRDTVKQIIEAEFAALDTAQVIVRLDAAGIANTKVNDVHDLWNHPQLKARNRWRTVGTPTGSLPALLPPGLGDDARMDPIPALGEHTDTILRELSYSAGDIAGLRAAGAIG